MPKGLEHVGDSRIIDRVALSLAKATDRIVLAANDPAAEHWLNGVPVMRDRHIGGGGLAGIDATFAGMANAAEPARDLLVVAWDMPFVSARLLQALIAAAASSGADVVAPESQSPYGIEPFCAYYASRVSKLLAQFLENGGGPARDFLSRTNLRRVPLADIRQMGDATRLLMSVNTEEDLERARLLAHCEL